MSDHVVGMIPLPIQLEAFSELATTYEPGLLTRQFRDVLIVYRPGWQAIDCWCIDCEGERNAEIREHYDGWISRTFIVCPDCGNKRCPKATSHEKACTGSNDPGQIGSVYA